MENSFGFIGAGNMGGAVARAVCSGLGAEKVLIFDPDANKSGKLSAETGCRVAESAGALALSADYIVLCVKPDLAAGVLRDLAPELCALSESGAHRVIVSIAAGISIADIARVLKEKDLMLPIIRLMPNTPLFVGRGMTVMACCPGVTDEERALVVKALSAGGEVLPIEEKLIDAATPVFSGSPAFVYMFIDALADGAVLAGLPRETALRLGAQAVLGAAAMVLETGKHPGQLKDEVCSPGGSTIVGVEELEKGGFRAAVASAVYEAYKKTAQLGKM